MKTEKITLMNAAWLAGIGASLFIVPANTPVWLWLVISMVVLAVLNYLFFFRRRHQQIGTAKTRAWVHVVGGFGVAVLVIEVLLHFFHR